MRAMLKSFVRLQAVRWPIGAVAGWTILLLTAQFVVRPHGRAYLTTQNVGLIILGGVMAAALGFGLDTKDLPLRDAARKNAAFGIIAATVVYGGFYAIAAIFSLPADMGGLDLALSWLVLGTVLTGVTFVGRWIWGPV